MKAKEIRAKKSEDLQELETQLTAEVFKLRFSKATEQLEKKSLIRTTKRELAKVKTILRERELGIVAGLETATGEQE